MEQTKDAIIGFKSTRVGKDSKGRDRLELSMNTEEVNLLISELTKLAASPNGVKLDIHTGKKVNGNTGMEFDSSFAFVKAIGEAPGRVAGFKPKAPTATSNNAQSVLRNATLKG